MQYKTKGSAMNALRRYTPLRSYMVYGETRSPAEEWLMHHLCDLYKIRMMKKEGDSTFYSQRSEKRFRELKSIARGLGLWDKSYIKVLVRLGAFPTDDTN